MTKLPKTVKMLTAAALCMLLAVCAVSCGENQGEDSDTTAEKVKISLQAVKNGETVAEGSMLCGADDEIPCIYDVAEDIFYKYDIMYSQKDGRYQYIADIGESSEKTDAGAVKYTWDCRIGDTVYTADEMHEAKPEPGDTIVFEYTGHIIEGTY